MNPLRRTMHTGSLAAAAVVGALALLAPVTASAQDEGGDEIQRPSFVDRPVLRDKYSVQKHKMPPAVKIEKLPLSGIELRVGQKRSFYPVHTAGIMDEKPVKMQIESDTLTLYGLRPGRTELIIFETRVARPAKRGREGTKPAFDKAPKVKVTVTP